MRTKVLAACAAAALLPLLLPTAVQAGHSWGPYHWERANNNPLTLTLGANVNQTWAGHLRTASTDWNTPTPTSLPDVLDTSVGSGGTAPETCAPTSGRVEVCNDAYGDTGWLGVASIWISRGKHIVAGTVKVNDTYFSSAYAGGFYDTDPWRQTVMCQEIGHTFGLDHQDENFSNANLGTCMDYSDDPDGGGDFGLNNEKPNAHDFEQLATIYAHTDGAKGGGKPPRGNNGNRSEAFPPAGDDESSWGRRVDGSRAEGHSTYVHELGGGRAMVTFVTWAR